MVAELAAQNLDFEICRRLGFPAWSGVAAMSFGQKCDLPFEGDLQRHGLPQGYIKGFLGDS